MKISPKSIASPAQAQLPTRTIKMRTATPSYEPASQEAPSASETPAANATPSEVLESRGLTPESTETAPEATQALSPQLTALARREKALRQQAEKLKADQEAWKAQQNGYISREDLKKDPFKALNDAGVTYEQLLQQEQSASPESALQAKIDALEARLSSFDKRQEDRQTQEYQQALKVIESDATLLVNSDPAFETIKAHGAVKEVVSLIEKIFETEGVIMDVTEAAQLVEDKLAENTIKQVQTFSQLKKVQAKLNPPKADDQKQQSTPQGKTLTNAMGVHKPLSARDRAILAFNNKLK